MATIWVDNVAGNNANDGILVVDGGTGPKATISGVTGASAVITAINNVMNVINTGTTYDIAANTNLAGGAALMGTSFTNFGAKIQAVEADGSPALDLVKIRYTVASGFAVGLRESQHYIVVKGFHVDRPNSTLVSTGTGLTFVNLNDNGAGTCGPLLVEGCFDESAAARNGALVRESSGSFLATGSVEIRYCFIKNSDTNGGVALTGSNHKTLLFHHNVCYRDISTSTNLIQLGANDNSANVNHQIYNNTFVTTKRNSWILSNGTFVTGAHASASKTCKNNVLVQFTADVGTDLFMTGHSTWEDIPWTGVRDIGYNVFVDPDGHSWATAHPYQVPWDPDSGDSAEGTSYWATDTVDEGAGADPFEDSGTPFDWSPNAIDYTLPLTGDYRLVQYRTAGEGGTVPGAIEDATTAVEIDVPTSLQINATVGDSVTQSITLTNLGTGTLTISSMTFNDDADGLLTYGGAESASVGSLASISLPFTFSPTSALQLNIIGTLTILSDDVDEPSVVVTVTGNAVRLWVPGDGQPATPVGPKSPGFFLNGHVSPGSRGSGMSAAIELWRNTVFEAQLATTIGGNSEYTTNILQGTMTIPVSSGVMQVPGINVTGLRKLYMITEGGPVLVQTGLHTFLLREGACFLAGNVSAFHTVLMTNASTIKDVRVHFFGCR